MGADDKVRNAVNDAKGAVKEKVGEMTDNPDLEAEGHMDRTKADLGKAAEDAKDALKGS